MTGIDRSDQMHVQMKQNPSCDYFAILLIEKKAEEF